MKDRIQEIWPEWSIVEELGSGSYGTVYKAVRTIRGIDFFSAIKVITISADQKDLQALNEILSLDLLKGNSHIVSIQDFKIVEASMDAKWEIFIRMEFLKSLNDYLAETEGLSEKEILKIGLDICDALKYCDREHIIHRDIKPENIFVSKYGDFKLGDFGIAKIINENSLTQSIKGTQNYMAPEIWKGENYSSNVDFYSLGLLLYYLSNDCRMPFINVTDSFISYSAREEAFLRRIRGERLSPPQNASHEFAEVILKACEYDPFRRYQSAVEFYEALEKCRTKKKEKNQGRRQKKINAGMKTVATVALAIIVITGLLGVLNIFRLNISNNPFTVNNYSSQSGDTINKPENVAMEEGTNIIEESSESIVTDPNELSDDVELTTTASVYPSYPSFIRKYADSWDMNEERKTQYILIHPDATYDTSYRLLYSLDDLDGNGVDEIVVSICTEDDRVNCFDIFTYNENGEIIDLIPGEDFALQLWDGSLGKIIQNGKKECYRIENGSELVQISQKEISEKGSKMFWSNIFNLNPDAWIEIKEGTM